MSLKTLITKVSASSEEKQATEPPKSGFRARKTLQKLGSSVLGQTAGFFSNLRFLFSKTQLTSDITSRIRIVLKTIIGCILRNPDFRRKWSHNAKKYENRTF